MIVSCPSCQKRYLIDEGVLSDQGREVRCGVCTTTWTENPRPAAISISSIEIDTVFGDARVKKRFKILPNFFLALTFLTLIMTIGFMARYPLLNAIPSLKPFYDYVGFASSPPKEGLHLESLSAFQTTVQGKPAVVIKGTLTNTTSETKEIAELNMSFQGPCSQGKWWHQLYESLAFLSDSDKKCTIDHWRHPLSQSRLMSGETLSFETLPHVFNTPPTSIHVDF